MFSYTTFTKSCTYQTFFSKPQFFFQTAAVGSYINTFLFCFQTIDFLPAGRFPAGPTMMQPSPEQLLGCNVKLTCLHPFCPTRTTLQRPRTLSWCRMSILLLAPPVLWVSGPLDLDCLETVSDLASNNLTKKCTKSILTGQQFLYFWLNI